MAAETERQQATIFARLQTLETSVREIPLLRSALKEADERIDNLVLGAQDISRSLRELGDMHMRALAQFTEMLQKQREEHRTLLERQEERSRSAMAALEKQYLESHERIVQEIIQHITSRVVRTTAETFAHWAWPALLAATLLFLGWLYHQFIP